MTTVRYLAFLVKAVNTISLQTSISKDSLTILLLVTRYIKELTVSVNPIFDRVAEWAGSHRSFLRPKVATDRRESIPAKYHSNLWRKTKLHKAWGKSKHYAHYISFSIIVRWPSNNKQCYFESHSRENAMYTEDPAVNTQRQITSAQFTSVFTRHLLAHAIRVSIIISMVCTPGRHPPLPCQI